MRVAMLSIEASIVRVRVTVVRVRHDEQLLGKPSFRKVLLLELGRGSFR